MESELTAPERYRVVVVVNAPQETLFDFVNQAEGMMHWVPLPRSVHYTHPGPDGSHGRGSVRTVKLKTGLSAVEEILEYEPTM